MADLSSDGWSPVEDSLVRRWAIGYELEEKCIFSANLTMLNFAFWPVVDPGSILTVGFCFFLIYSLMSY